jgi:hypothetical protein
MGKGSTLQQLTKQNIDNRSLTEAELVAVYALMTQIFCLKYF